MYFINKTTHPYMRNFLTIFLEYLALLNSTKSSEKQRKKLNKNTILKTQVTLFVPGKEQIKTTKKRSCRGYIASLQQNYFPGQSWVFQEETSDLLKMITINLQYIRNTSQFFKSLFSLFFIPILNVTLDHTS